MINRSSHTRRSFLKTAAAASTAIALPMYIPSRVLGRDGATGPTTRSSSASSAPAAGRGS